MRASLSQCFNSVAADAPDASSPQQRTDAARAFASFGNVIRNSIGLRVDILDTYLI